MTFCITKKEMLYGGVEDG